MTLLKWQWAKSAELDEREAVNTWTQSPKEPGPQLQYYPPQRDYAMKCLISGLVLEKAKVWIRAYYDRALKCLCKKQTTKQRRPNLESGHRPDMGEHMHENHESH